VQAALWVFDQGDQVAERSEPWRPVRQIDVHQLEVDFLHRKGRTRLFDTCCPLQDVGVYTLYAVLSETLDLRMRMRNLTFSSSVKCTRCA